MGYYMGAGDYYRGDGNYAAGGFFSSIGKAIGSVAKVALPAVGTLVGGPLGGILGGAVSRGLAGGGGGAPQAAAAQAGMPVVPVPGLRGLAQRVIPGGATGLMVAKGKTRRINPLNIKALRRAMRRAKGFEKQARRVGSFFNPGKSFRLKGRKRRSK